MDAPAVTAPSGSHDEGHAVAAARKARRLTQAELARQVAISLSLLRKIEQGDRALTPGVRAAIIRVVGPLPALSGDAPLPGRIAAAVPLLQDAMDCYDLPPALTSPPRPLAELRAVVMRVTQSRLASRYAELADLLPGLLSELTTVAMTSTGHQQEQAYGILALAYRAADAIADKHGYRDMSARAVELTRWAAARSGDPVLEMMAAYVRAELFFAGSHTRAGLRLLDKTAGAPPPERHVPRLAMYGALQMRGAVLAARAGMPGEAADRMTEASAAASRVPDGIYAGTAFGPSSVRVHELASAVEAGDTSGALRLASRWQPPPTLPAERRSHFHIEAARAYHWAGDSDLAISSLWEARLTAPQHTRCSPAAARTVQALMHVRRQPPASLASLAIALGEYCLVAIAWYYCHVAISRGEYLVTTAGDLGAALKHFRMAAGITQEQAAELEGIGQSYLSLLEGGKKLSPSVTHVLRLLRFVGCEVVVRPRGGHG